MAGRISAIAASALLLMFAVATQGAEAGVAGSARIIVEPGWQFYRWQEFSNTRQPLLEESGLRLALGAQPARQILRRSGLYYDYSAQIFFGKVNYDGQTTDGTPLKTDVDYLGGGLEFVAGKRLAQTAIPLRFSLLTAIGTELWQRRIADAVTANGRIASGLTEQYRIVYGRLGMKTGKQIQLREGAITLGLKYPLIAREQVSGFDSALTLRPGRQAALYGRLVLAGKRSTAGRPGALVLYYESYRLRSSAEKASSIAGVPVTVFQPQSHMDILGMSFWLFF